MSEVNWDTVRAGVGLVEPGSPIVDDIILIDADKNT